MPHEEHGHAEKTATRLESRQLVLVLLVPQFSENWTRGSGVSSRPRGSCGSPMCTGNWPVWAFCASCIVFFNSLAPFSRHAAYNGPQAVQDLDLPWHRAIHSVPVQYMLLECL